MLMLDVFVFRLLLAYFAKMFSFWLFRLLISRLLAVLIYLYMTI